MSKKKSSGGSINSVRKDIQRVDRELIKLLGDRARAAQKLAKIRQEDGTALYDLNEEQQGLTELLSQNKGPLDEAAVRAIFREILGAARSLVKPVRVAYLGPRYSFSHLAAINRFGDGPDLTPQRRRLVRTAQPTHLEPHRPPPVTSPAGPSRSRPSPPATRG